MRASSLWIAIAVVAASPLVHAAGKPDKKATQALLAAADAGDVPAIKAALQKKAEIDGTDAEANTPLMGAAAGGHAEAVKALLDAGAQIDKQNAGQLDALMLAAQRGDRATVDVLLAARASPSATDRRGRTALMLASARGHVAVIEALLAAGADVNAGNEDNRTPLHFAAAEGHLEAVKALLKAKADVSAKNSDGDTPFALAENGEHAEVAALLRPKGAGKGKAGEKAAGKGADKPAARSGVSATATATSTSSSKAAAPSGADFAKGTLTVNGKTVTLNHAYLLPDSGTPPAVLVFLTDVPVAESVLGGGPFSIDKVTDAGEAHLVKIRITLGDKEATSSSVYHSALSGGDTSVVGAGDWKPTTVTASRVEGKVSMAAPRTVPEGTYQYNATFRASYGIAATPAAESTSSLVAGKASGKMTVIGKSVNLTHAYAWVDTKDEEKPVVVLVASHDVTEQARRDDFELTRQARDGQLSAVRLYFDKDRNIVRGDIYDAGFQGSMSATGMHMFEAVTFSAQAIEGRIHTRAEQDFFGKQWSYSASFKALIKR